MARLTEEMVIARSKQSDLTAIKKLNCWYRCWIDELEANLRNLRELNVNKWQEIAQNRVQWRSLTSEAKVYYGSLSHGSKGAELVDVSLLRRMPNVEVLAFSINKIRTLGDFAGCRRLRELYVRKNEIRDLAEIRHLRRLPDLTSLWLDENPCTHHPEYRMTVLRNLPNLEKLDNVAVHPEEVQEAMRKGAHIPDSDDEGYPQQESYGQYRRQRSCESSPEREPDQYYRTAPVPHPAHPAHPVHPTRHEGSDSSAEGGEPAETRPPDNQCAVSPPRRPSPEPDERYEHPAMTTSHYETRGGPRSPDAASLRHSVSAHSVKDYSYASNGEWRQSGGVVTSPQGQENYCERPDRSDTYSRGGDWDRERERDSARERDREYPSAVMAEHRGFTRRPVARNSNLLSAVLCLVKELDYPSLEVAEMAVRCRMDELANSQ